MLSGFDDDELTAPDRVHGICECGDPVHIGEQSAVVRRVGISHNNLRVYHRSCWEKLQNRGQNDG